MTQKRSHFDTHHLSLLVCGNSTSFYQLYWLQQPLRSRPTPKLNTKYKPFIKLHKRQVRNVTPEIKQTNKKTNKTEDIVSLNTVGSNMIRSRRIRSIFVQQANAQRWWGELYLGHLRLRSGDYKAVTTTTGATKNMLALAFVDRSLGTKQLHPANDC